MPVKIRQDFKKLSSKVEHAALWLGRVTHLANSQPGPVRRDSEASRLRASSRRHARDVTPRSARVEHAPQPVRLLQCLEPLRARIAARAAAQQASGRN